MQCIEKGSAYALIGVVITASEESVEWYHESGDRGIKKHNNKPSELHRVGVARLARKDLVQ